MREEIILVLTQRISADTKMKNCKTKTSLMNSEGPKTKLVLILRFSF